MAVRKKGKSRRIGLRDRLGRLTLRGVYRLLGEDAAARLRRGGEFAIEIAEHVYLGRDTLRVIVPDPELPGRGQAIVSFVEMTTRPKGVHYECDSCPGTCVHVAAVFSLLLEEKLALGLSAPPDPAEPLEMLTEEELLRRALGDRQARAEKEKMRVVSTHPKQPWTDYMVTSQASGKTYRVALRGTQPGQSYCSCPDFRANHLGTCKHILNTLRKVERKFSQRRLQRPYVRRGFSLRLHYGSPISLHWNLPDALPSEACALLTDAASSMDMSSGRVTRAADALRQVRALERAGYQVQIYPDAEEFISQQLLQDQLQRIADEIRQSPADHPLRKQLLKTELLPYQLDGIAFAVGAGRAILADDMGLGKTIQGIGVAELLAQQANISRVLVVCPASVKAQWRGEIQRFTDRSSRIVQGSAKERAEQYAADTFFTICNYEQILRDHATMGKTPWDLIILDEGQRIKNWESKTARLTKSLQSRFALVLSGTPLENRLEELFAVVSFVDEQRLGPAYRFMHRHRIINDQGRIEGYKNLDQLRARLRPILLRRTRGDVMQELPERTTEVVRIVPTQEQFDLSEAHVAGAARIAAKKYLTEIDLLRLQQHLLMARMACDSTFLVDKQAPGYSSKLEAIRDLVLNLLDEPDRKIILFSEWTTMLDLITAALGLDPAQLVRLDGKVSLKNRQAIVHQFQNDPSCRLIMMSNAGTTGLNLQAANTVINVDLPWNPAVLEQRVARAHRMGQRNPVQVFLLVTENTIEERMLDTLSAKHDLALAALDADSQVNIVELRSGMEELRRRLERLLGKTPPAPVDAAQQQQVAEQTETITARRERVAAAGGELLGAAIQLVGELLETNHAPSPRTVDELEQGLSRCVERDADGRPQLRVTLQDDTQLRGLATALAKLLVVDNGQQGQGQADS